MQARGRIEGMLVEKSVKLQRRDGKFDTVQYEYDGDQHYVWVWGAEQGPGEDLSDYVHATDNPSDLRGFLERHWADAPGLPAVLAELNLTSP